MKKYYYKNESGDVYTNDPNVFDTNTKPITACYSGTQCHESGNTFIERS